MHIPFKEPSSDVCRVVLGEGDSQILFENGGYVSRKESGVEADEGVGGVVSLTNKAVITIEDQTSVLFSKKKLVVFCRQLEEEINRITLRVNNIAKNSGMN